MPKLDIAIKHFYNVPLKLILGNEDLWVVEPIVFLCLLLMFTDHFPSSNFLTSIELSVKRRLYSLVIEFCNNMSRTLIIILLGRLH